MAIGRAARAGIFVKGGDALERLAKPGRMFLDKTGTITESRTALVEWHGEEWVKPLVLALESGSSHPIAAAFRRAWPRIEVPTATDTQHLIGGGITGRVGAHRVVVGSPAFVASQIGGVDRPRTTDALTPVWIAVDDTLSGIAGIGDPIRPDATQSIASLRSAGWSVSILSGDAPGVVETVGAHVGIEAAQCVGAASPEAKLAAIEASRPHGTVVMVGDGINDAAAMAAASVGVGVHGGAEACLASADVYMTRPGLGSLAQLVAGAQRTLRVIERNVAFSLVYNTIGAALAMSGRLTPLVAAILMPASSLTVVLASWRARTFEL
jgi:Cu2+-exporting ATPase